MTTKTEKSEMPICFERHVARLLIVLYYCGQPVARLLDGETREAESLWQLQQFDFWVREPGHLALALLRAYADVPESIKGTDLRAAVERMLNKDQVDIRRVPMPGAPYSIFSDFDDCLSFMTGRKLVSDRPSFVRTRGKAHRVVLETDGMELTRKILDTCPEFAWYRLQCELVAANINILSSFNLNGMDYLAPDMTPAMAAALAMAPYVRQRLEKTLGESNLC
jgi:hypothetical protein